ncbi:MAG: hypothetical protein JNL41_02900 [Phenylobacterium sp.]|uniref:CC0125/CC1285 family lipoprotein n=1 Tax=Phenylobacterium sp. TaxID=1871053 RepID=UPI001A4A1B32|nr:hypothetical protein [Phenylobacterium sp.]MBL8553201.1 hypothetical protein [Phenylobacterium sp.]
MKRLVLISLAAAALAACETMPTTYRPAAPGRDAVGYSEYRIEPGRYRITFRGGPGAPPEQVSDYALLRAADLALAEGYDWFRVSDRFLRGRPDGGPQVSFGIGGGSFGRRSGVGVGVSSGGMSLGGGPAVSSTIEVLMGRGERPRGADVYDARGIRQSLGPRT